MRLFIFGDVTLDRIFSVDWLPAEGECRVIRSSKALFGGRGANIAIATGRLGMSVALCSIAGRDFFPSGYASQLKKHNVDIESLTIVEEAETSRFSLYEDQEGGSYAFYEPCVDMYYDTLAFDIRRLKGYDMVHFTLAHEKFAGKVLDKLEHTKKILSASLGREIYLISARYLRRLLGTCEYLFMNETEAGILKAKVKTAGGTELFTNYSNLQAIAITSGEAGSVIHTRREKIKIPAVKAKRATNPLGAGDAYVAGFLYGVSKKYDMRTCGKIASAVASFAVVGYGAQSSLPDLGRVKRRYLDAFGSALS